MKNSKLEEVLKKEKTKKEKLLVEREILDKKIKEADEKIEELTMTLNSEKFNAFQNALNNKGISFESIMEAVKAGDLLSLQETLEKTKETEIK